MKPKYKLLPCPFCGHSNIKIETHIHSRLFATCCNAHCGGNSGFCDNTNEVMQVWNKRDEQYYE